MSRNQLNIRVSDELETAIDEKRIELMETMKVIPTRSDVVRYALESYLGISLAESDADRRKTKEHISPEPLRSKKNGGTAR